MRTVTDRPYNLVLAQVMAAADSGLLTKVNKYLPLDTASYTERLGIPSTLL